MRTGILRFACLTLASASPARAQLPVVGTVVDPGNTPIAGADVLLGSRKATTGIDGTFRIDSIKPGSYALTVRAIGFWPQRARINFQPPFRPVRIILRPGATLLPEIVVEGRRTGIFGTVGDPKTGGRIGAKVEVVGHRGGITLTDSAGAFSFPKADRGDYLIVVSLEGYQQRRLSLRIDDGKGRELAIHMYPGTEGRPSSMESWAFEALRTRLTNWPRQSRMTSADFAKFDGVESICDVARIQMEDSRRPTVVLNGTLTLQSWSLCDFMADEIELIEFGSSARMGRRAGAAPPRGGIIYIWERR